MLSISTNVASLNAQRTLNKNQKSLATSFQRLSTGLRVNSAKDDSAGLAIANRLSAQVRGLNQAARNANDAISLAQTAESALNEQSSMLQRLRELAVQAANDTNTSTDRAAIQTEADALISEIDRIATQTTFNNRNLLDGSLSAVKFHVGANASESISVSVSSARSFNLGTVYSATSSTMTTNALAAGTLLINGTSVAASSANDDTVSSSYNSASAMAKAAAINATTSEHGVTATIESNTYNAGAVTTGPVTTGEITVNGVNIGAVTTVANDTDSALRNAINAVAGTTGVQATLDASNNLILTASDGRNIIVAGTDATGSGALAAAAAGNYIGTVTLKSDSAITITGANESYAGLANNQAISTASTVNVDTLDFTSQTGANTALSTLDDAIRQVSTRQASLGATLNRMDAAVSQLAAASENTAAARGRIQDADFASETAKFSKNQILQQASSAMLAQANVAGQIALSLLG